MKNAEKMFRSRVKSCSRCKDVHRQVDNQFLCKRFGWLIESGLARVQALCNFDRVTETEKQ